MYVIGSLLARYVAVKLVNSYVYFVYTRNLRNVSTEFLFYVFMCVDGIKHVYSNGNKNNETLF